LPQQLESMHRKEIFFIALIALSLCLYSFIMGRSSSDKVRKLPHPSFSHDSGFYEDEFELEISSPDGRANIYFTTDGSVPDPAGNRPYYYKNSYPVRPGDPFGDALKRSLKTYLYEEPIQVSTEVWSNEEITGISTQASNRAREPKGPVPEAVVIRARLVKEGYLPGPVKTGTYFVNHQASESFFKVPVVSLVLPESSLFDYETGIYVAGQTFDNWRHENPDSQIRSWNKIKNYTKRGRDWERRANFQYFTPEGDKVIDQTVGVRIHGGTSRGAARKSLRIYARSEYGEETINYRFFESVDTDTFKRLILRNSGNDQGTTLFRDAFMQSLFEDLDLDYQAYQPVILFINGVYWGIHNIRDRLDRYYLQYRHGVDPYNIDLFQNKVDRSRSDSLRFKRRIDEGGSEHYLAMTDFMRKNDITKDEVYQQIRQMLDIGNFIDYYISHIFVGNTDWPHNNLRAWRVRTDSYKPDAPYGHDGRWRWILFDTDHGFGYRGDNSERDVLRQATRRHKQTRATFLFRMLLRNGTFKEKFANQFADYLNSILISERIIDRIDTMEETFRPLMQDHITRWGWPSSLDRWKKNVEVLREFARERPDNVRRHIVKNLNLRGLTDLKVNIAEEGTGKVQLNSLKLDPGSDGWEGVYFKGVKVRLEAVPAENYEFERWDGLPQDSEPVVYVNPGDYQAVTAYFRKRLDS